MSQGYHYLLDHAQVSVIVKALRTLDLTSIPHDEAARAVRLIYTFQHLGADQMIIARRPVLGRKFDQPQMELILAYLPKNDITPWVTWFRENPDRGGNGVRFWGSYFKDYQSAANDFKKRKM